MSFAHLARYRVAAKGGSGVPPFSAPATTIHHQHQMYGSSRGGEPRGARSIHAPVVDHKSQQGGSRVRVVCRGLIVCQAFASDVDLLPLTGRGFGSGLFSQFGSQPSRQAIADTPPSIHFKASIRYVPNIERGQIDAVHENHKPGATHDR